MDKKKTEKEETSQTQVDKVDKIKTQVCKIDEIMPLWIVDQLSVTAKTTILKKTPNETQRITEYQNLHKKNSDDVFVDLKYFQPNQSICFWIQTQKRPALSLCLLIKTITIPIVFPVVQEDFSIDSNELKKFQTAEITTEYALSVLTVFQRYYTYKGGVIISKENTDWRTDTDINHNLFFPYCLRNWSFEDWYCFSKLIVGDQVTRTQTHIRKVIVQIAKLITPNQSEALSKIAGINILGST